jgi:hypothetical protein
MFWNLTTVALCIVTALVAYWLWPRLAAAFKRFDAENRDRIERQLHERGDHTAHFRHTLDVAQEQVEEIAEISERDPRTGTAVKRYVFEGVWYATRDEAERERAKRIGDIARGFYHDLPAALAARRSDGRLS